LYFKTKTEAAVFRPATTLELEDAFTNFGAARHARLVAKESYVANTPVKNAATYKLRLYISQFIQHLNDAIIRGDIEKSKRVLYNLDENDGAVPPMGKEQDIVDWAGNIIQGEADRILGGGTALVQPSAADISTLLTDAQAKLAVQSNFYTIYNAAQENLQTLVADADKFIRKAWAEIESAFADDLDAGSRRTKAEQWGVVYITVGAKKANIIVEVLDSETNEPLADATAEFAAAGFEIVTGADGKAKGFDDYVGADNLTVTHLDYTTQVIPVELVEGEDFKIQVKLVKVE
jgi:hypothetical protein